MITIRHPATIYQAHGDIDNGTFAGRWHFSFDQYYDPHFTQFGPLRVFNDDTLSPGAVWPLHPHEGIEVVTYCAAGEFRHADEHGKGGVLQKGSVQHTSVGRGMWHSEINNRADVPMRFIQMWFLPEKENLEPAVQQKAVTKAERTNRFFPLVAKDIAEALPLFSPARVFSCFLEAGHEIEYVFAENCGGYLYVVEGGPIEINGQPMPELAAALITREPSLRLKATNDAELLLVDVGFEK
ncbi:MAG: pirin family protein [Alphaproteobacteria bacterium]|nr:pirin family protein [Alphaproteobacteria bacterium]